METILRCLSYFSEIGNAYALEITQKCEEAENEEVRSISLMWRTVKEFILSTEIVLSLDPSSFIFRDIS